MDDTEVGSSITVKGATLVLLFSLGDLISKVPFLSVELNSSIGVIAYC